MKKFHWFFFCFLVSLFARFDGAEERVCVYVDIVGDLFHAGHVEFLKKAKSFGNYLIVGVLADDVVEGYKRIPVMSLEERAKVIAACKYVDQVVIAPPLRLTEEMVEELGIDYIVHGDDFKEDLLEDQYGVALKLGLFRTVPYTPGISSTDIIQRIITRYNQGDFKR